MRIVVQMVHGTDPADAIAQLSRLWGITHAIPARLPAPMATLLRSAVSDDPPQTEAMLSELRALL